MSRVTINDVARASDTSKKTVSRVLNQEPGVRKEVRERVLAAVAELNYRPLTSARSLATNRSFMNTRYPSSLAMRAAAVCACLFAAQAMGGNMPSPSHLPAWPRG